MIGPHEFADLLAQFEHAHARLVAQSLRGGVTLGTQAFYEKAKEDLLLAYHQHSTRAELVDIDL